jgi:hypothetical protein
MPPPSPSFQEAQDASKSYLGFTRHPFPRCFACGPQRNVGDGLRIFPGLIESRSMVAAPWLPDASLADDSHSVRAEFIWAALDCTSGLAVLPVPEGQAIVLGELSARIDGRVVAGEKYIAVGWPLSIDGRKRLAGSAIFSESGLPLAIGRALWIEVPENAFLPTRSGPMRRGISSSAQQHVRPDRRLACARRGRSTGALGCPGSKSPRECSVLE